MAACSAILKSIDLLILRPEDKALGPRWKHHPLTGGETGPHEANDGLIAKDFLQAEFSIR